MNKRKEIRKKMKELLKLCLDIQNIGGGIMSYEDGYEIHFGIKKVPLECSKCGQKLK